MFGSRVIGTVRATSGVGPRDAGKSPPKEVPPGSGPSTGERAEPIATSQAGGPISGWKKGRITAAGTLNTAGDMTTAGAAAGIVNMMITTGATDLSSH